MRTVASAAVLLLAATVACGPRPADVRGSRGVLVIAIDALRADHVTAAGYDRPTTSALDRLAAQGVAFTDAWSASPDVLPSHAALLSGCDPGLARRPGLARVGPASDLSSWSMPDGMPSLAQEFLAQGFETAAFVDHPAVSPIRGVARGFQTFGGYREDALDPELELGFEGVATKFIHWLNGRSADADWFAYLHVNDLERVWAKPAADGRWETLYEPREELAAMPPVAEGDHAFFAIPRPRWAGVPRTLGEYEVRYDGAIAQLDGKLGRLIERLRRTGRLENTTVVVVGTFGVSFGEHGLFLDTGALSAADLRVPFVLRPGDHLPMQRDVRLDGLVSLLDLAPTLLELHGLQAPAGMSGISHAERMRVPGSPSPRAIAHAAGGFQRGVAAIDAHWILAREQPAEATSTLLVRSWYGGDAPADAPPFERLTAWAPGAGDEAAAGARLAPDLATWDEWIERARPILHGRAAPASDPKIAAELRKRGILPR